MKKMKEPEFVRAEDLEDLSDDEEEETEADALGRANAVANAKLENEDDDEDEDETKTPLSKDEAKARQERIKKHVTKVVIKKKRESQVKPIELQKEDVDIMGEIEKYTQFGFLKKKILITMVS